MSPLLSRSHPVRPHSVATLSKRVPLLARAAGSLARAWRRRFRQFGEEVSSGRALRSGSAVAACGQRRLPTVTSAAPEAAPESLALGVYVEVVVSQGRSLSSTGIRSQVVPFVSRRPAGDLAGAGLAPLGDCDRGGGGGATYCARQQYACRSGSPTRAPCRLQHAAPSGPVPHRHTNFLIPRYAVRRSSG